jgi:hypothetical protein
MMSALIRSPFRRVNECIKVIDKIDDSILSELENNIVPFFIRMLERRYGVRVHLLNDTREVEGRFIVLADTRMKSLFARICGADYELERTYRLVSPNHKPIYVSFESWIPEHCGVHCYYNVDKHTLTLMPMTAAILRFPEVIRARVEPL